MRRGAIIVGLLAALAVGGCSKKDDAAPAAPAEVMPPPMSAAAATQVRDACTAYVDHVCGCAAAKPDDAALAEQCTLAKTIPGALDLAIGAAQAPQKTKVDAEGALGNVGKIQKSCIEEAARLETSCPRASVSK